MPDTDLKRSKAFDGGWKPLLLPCILLSVTVGVFVPLETYLSIAQELWFALSELVPVLIVVTILLFVVSMGLGLLLRGTLRAVYCALMVGGSLGLYLQGLFLNTAYGVLDGTPIDWSAFGSYPIWNTVIWLLLLLAPIVLILINRNTDLSILRFMAMLLVLTQAMSAGMQFFSTDLSGKGEIFYLTRENEFHFSKNKNIIVFGFDRLSPTLFQELWENYPGTFNEWDGFVNFSNSTGKFGGTQWSIANLLTGKSYNVTEDENAYLSRAYSQAPYWPVLRENNYRIDMYTTEGISSECERLFDNCKTGKIQITNHFELFKKMYKMSLFRYAPHILKPYFWMDGSDFEQLKKIDENTYYKDDANYRLRLDKQGVTADLDQNSFHFYFLRGAHPGFIMDTPTTYLEPGKLVSQHVQSLNALDTVTAVLKGLKEIGVYDDALIILMGDHGDNAVDGRPAFVVKRPGSTGSLSENDSFVSQDDFWATIYAIAGIDATDEKGLNVFEVGDLKRSFEYNFLPFETTTQYVYDITLLNDGTIHYEQRDVWYNEQGAHEVVPRQVRFDTFYPWRSKLDAMSFSDFMNQSRQIAKSDGSAVWLCKPDVTLRLEPTGGEPESVSLLFDLDEVMNGRQRVAVARGDTVYETIEVTQGMEQLRVDVPDECYQDGVVVLELRFPDGRSVFEENGYQNALDPYYKQSIAVSGLRVVDTSTLPE